MTVCPRCTSPVEEGVRFCPKCGAAQPVRPAPFDGATQMAPSSIPAYTPAGGAPASGYPAAPAYSPAYAPGPPMYEVPPLPPTYAARKRRVSPLIWAAVAAGVLVLCAVVGFGGFFAYREVQLSNYYSRADTAIREERWDDAIKELDGASGIDSGYKDVKAKKEFAVRQKTLAGLYNDGVAALQAGDNKTAFAKFDQIVKTDTNYKDAVDKRAQAEKALKVEAAYGAAIEAIKAEQWRAAVEKLDEVIGLDPNYKDAQAQRRNAASQLKLSSSYAAALQAIEASKWDQALDQLNQVLAIDPKYKDAAARKADIEGKRATLAPFSFRLTNVQWNGANYDDQNLDITNQLSEKVGLAKIWARYSWNNVADPTEKVFIIGLKLTDLTSNASATTYLMAYEPPGFRDGAGDARLVLVRGNGTETLKAGALTLTVNYQASIDPSPTIVSGGRTGPGENATFRSYSLALGVAKASQA